MRFKINPLTLAKYGIYYCVGFVINTILKLIVEKGHAVYTWQDMGIFTACNALVFIVFFNRRWGILRDRF